MSSPVVVSIAGEAGKMSRASAQALLSLIHALPKIKNLYRISQRFNLRFSIGLGLGRYYAVLDLTHVIFGYIVLEIGTSAPWMIQCLALGKQGQMMTRI
jgi:hypothetical protein